MPTAARTSFWRCLPMSCGIRWRRSETLCAFCRRGAPDRSEFDTLRAMMERQVEHLVRMVDDLMDVSRIMRGRIELRTKPLKLAEIVARAVETARPAIDARGHELSVSVPAEPVWIRGDLVRLAQVFANLLTNAAKYTEGAGRISLAARSDGELRGSQRPRQWHRHGAGAACRESSIFSCRETVRSAVLKGDWESVSRSCAGSWRCTAARFERKARVGATAVRSSFGCPSAQSPCYRHPTGKAATGRKRRHRVSASLSSMTAWIRRRASP